MVPPTSSRIKEIVLGLDHSYLFIQGPPGSGKTYTALSSSSTCSPRCSPSASPPTATKPSTISWATSRSLPARLTFAVEEVELAQTRLRIRARGPADRQLTQELRLHRRTWASSARRHRVALVSSGHAPLCRLPGLRRGRTDLARRRPCHGHRHVRNLVLLGDPLQLAQVSQGAHPLAQPVSVLEHLLGEDGTIPPRARRVPRPHPTHAPRRLPSSSPRRSTKDASRRSRSVTGKGSMPMPGSTGTGVRVRSCSTTRATLGTRRRRPPGLGDEISK